MSTSLRTELPPEPTEFGLTEARATYFRSFPNRLDWLPGLLGWLSFVLLILLSGRSHLLEWLGKGKDGRAWVLILLFIPGILLGLLIGWAYPIFREQRKLRQLDYHLFINYREAYAKYAQTQRALAEVQRRERLDAERELRKAIDWWKSLDGFCFEKELSTLLKEKGFIVKHTGRSGDQGVDLELQFDGKKIIVQCKAFKNYVSPAAVRELYGTLVHFGADEAWLVTTRGFYSGAISFAVDKKIRLLTIEEVIGMPPAEHCTDWLLHAQSIFGCIVCHCVARS